MTTTGDMRRPRVVCRPIVCALVATSLQVGGCSRHPPNDVTESASASAAPARASAEVAKILTRELLADDDVDAGDAEQAVIDQVRRESWDEAWTALEALPEPKKRRPTLRLLRGRIAMQRGDHAIAVA